MYLWKEINLIIFVEIEMGVIEAVTKWHKKQQIVEEMN